MWSRGKSENDGNILLLFGCLGFTYFCVEAFSYVSGETSVQTSFLTFPLWFSSKA